MTLAGCEGGVGCEGGEGLGVRVGRGGVGWGNEGF